MRRMESLTRRWDATVAWAACRRVTLFVCAATAVTWALMLYTPWPEREPARFPMCDGATRRVTELTDSGAPGGVAEEDLVAALAAADATCGADLSQRVRREVAEWRADPRRGLSCDQAREALDELTASHPDPKVTDTELVEASAAAMAGIVGVCSSGEQAEASDALAGRMSGQEPRLPPELSEGGEAP